MTTKQKQTPFAIHRLDGETDTLYVKASYSGIHYMVVLADGLPLTFFGKGKTAYLTVQQAIDWHKKELRESNGHSGSSKILQLLQEAQAAFERGNVIES